MESNKSSLNQLIDQSLPDEIYICYQPFETDINKVDMDILQNQSGRNLVKKMAKKFLHAEEVTIYTQKNEKPEVYCSGLEVSASFSHTTNGVAGAISRVFNVGCDMENADRGVHHKLVDRMKQDDEKASLYDDNDAVRIWTLKESALKMIGTGLRKPMKSVQLLHIDTNLFSVRFDDGKEANICSFRHINHWISICYSSLSM